MSPSLSITSKKGHCRVQEFCVPPLPNPPNETERLIEKTVEESELLKGNSKKRKSQYKFGQLSDHYGVEAELFIEKKEKEKEKEKDTKRREKGKKLIIREKREGEERNGTAVEKEKEVVKKKEKEKEKSEKKKDIVDSESSSESP